MFGSCPLGPRDDANAGNQYGLVLDSNLFVTSLRMKHRTYTSSGNADCDWSNRLLLLALFGILFLTLYPFRFSSPTKLPPGASPFLLGTTDKGGGPRDIVLNILLFVPFGFALGAKLRRCGKGWRSTVAWAWLAGAILSYTIEFLQLYIPPRDSGWEDVISNSTGSLVGCAMAILLASWLFGILSAAGARLNRWVNPAKVAAVLLVYFTAWFAWSLALDKRAGLANWKPDCFLVIGNDAAGRHHWNGRVRSLEIWNRAWSGEAAEKLTRAEPAPTAAALVAFDFSGPSGPQENAELRIPFSAPPISPAAAADSHAEAGIPWAISAEPVTQLVENLRQAGQFSIRVVFEPAEGEDSTGQILSISNPAGESDIYLGQERGRLVFWYRNPVSAPHPGALIWTTSSLLGTSRPADVLYSYDGSRLRLYLNGRKIETRPMGPSLALASLVRRVKQNELDGYQYIYYAAIFFPAGGLLGIALRNYRSGPRQTALLIACTVLGAPLAMEGLFMRTEGRAFSWADFVLSVCYLVLAMLWVNSDGLGDRPYSGARPVRS
jgi:VanZ family protein